MDEIVRQAMAKWPNVPHCYGWLALDQRGQWRMRDDATQQAGLPGDIIRHGALIAFINRNYACDELGQWFFQNGPQRVYVELAYTPWVLRFAWQDEHACVTDHAGGSFVPSQCLLDDEGYVLLVEEATEASPATSGISPISPISPRIGVLHDHDVGLLTDHTNLADAAGRNASFLRWRNGQPLPLTHIARSDVPANFGFEPHPAENQST